MELCGGGTLDGTFRQRTLLATLRTTHPTLPPTGWSLWPEAPRSSRWGTGLNPGKLRSQGCLLPGIWGTLGLYLVKAPQMRGPLHQTGPRPRAPHPLVPELCKFIRKLGPAACACVTDFTTTAWQGHHYSPH